MSIKMIPAYYKGKLYELCLIDWFRFLKDKPVHHYCRQKISDNIKNMNKLGLTTEQCLGLERMPPVRKKAKKNKIPMVSKSEIPAYELANKFLSKALVSY